jgi:L-2-hydroxyglutarate oxidase LhgO
MNTVCVYEQIREELESNGCQIKIGCEVNSISKSNDGKFIVPYI